MSTTLTSSEWENTEGIINERVTEEVAKLKQEDGAYILVPGSATLVHTLLEAGLVDELRLLVHPVIMGSGLRFSLTKSEPLDMGVLALTYERASTIED